MRKRSFLLFSLVVWMACSSLLAQAGTEGSILGVVKDQSGAVIPGADVKVTNLETGLTATRVADQDGYFEVLPLPRGIYSVTVSIPGFQTWRLERVQLTVGEQKRVFPILQVGEVTNQITVQAGVEILQTESPSVEMAVEEKQILELPLEGRNAINLVNLVPGMRWLGVGGRTRNHNIQGVGQRVDQNGFTLDGVDSNDTSDERGMAFPNLESVEQFSVKTSNFNAEDGRMPVQVKIVTKGGTNRFRGTLWEFHRNDALDARNAMAQSDTNPKLIRNLFGFAFGGPLVKNKTFFFTSYEGDIIRRDEIYNAPTISPKMLQGDFSDLTKRINDPLTGKPFPGNKIPENRFSNASRFFFPHLLLPNSPGNRFRDVAPHPNDVSNWVTRIDYQIDDSQRIYFRWVRVAEEEENPGYKPEVVQTEDLVQHNMGVNYNWSISPSTLFTFSGGFVYSDSKPDSPVLGQKNLTANAGIRGFPTPGRELEIGLPEVRISGYTGFLYPNTTGRFRRENIHGKASFSLIRGKHSLGFGYEFNDRRTLAAHSSSSSRGLFTFNSQYTGDGFADYLLGLVQFVQRNFPLRSFGMGHSPYSAAYVQDSWKVHPNLTLNLALRLDYWHEKRFVRDTGATYDPTRKKIIAGVAENGQVDLTAQPTAPFLAKATEGLWIPASEAGIPRGLFESTGLVSPRLGAAWRIFGNDDWVLRGGYGIYTSNYNGNITGSQIIGPPYWTFERVTFSRASRQRWETAFPEDPKAFIAASVAAAAYNVKPMKSHQYNLSLQKSLPWLKSAVTVSYVGNRGFDLITQQDYNEVQPGQYQNLQTAKPFPPLGTVRLYENIGDSWYNSLQIKAHRRFVDNFGYTFSYALSRHIGEFADSITDRPTPFAPQGYDRGRSDLERRHILTLSSIWQLPFGRGKRLAAGVDPVLDALVGGWQLTGVYRFVSGPPLTFTVTGATLGNGFNTRPNLVGNPKSDHPSAELWFNPAAFAIPPRFTFGNSGIGLLDGPGDHTVNLALMKNFYFTEDRYLQVRGEMFNALDHVNLGQPETRVTVRTVGQIFSANEPRQMQIGLKLIF